MRGPTGPKNPEIIEMIVFCYSKNIISTFWTKMERNNSTEFRNIFFPYIYHKNG